MDRKLFWLGFVLAITSIVSLAITWQNRPSETTRRKTTYERILDSKTIRVAYISYPPSFIKDPKTGEYSGVFHEVLSKMAERMELKIEYVEETAWGTMIESVRSGRVDLVCTGIWPNAARGKFVDFTDPIYFSLIRAYVKAGNDRLTGNLGTINSPAVKIATIDGEMSSIIAKADFPSATVHALPQTTDISQLLLEVATDKADITFVESAVANAFLEKNPNMIAEVKAISPLRVFPNVMMIAKGETELLSMLNIALNEIANDGQVDRIISRYETTPGLLLRRSPQYRDTAE